MFTFGTVYYEPFLTDAGQTITTYVVMNEYQCRPFNIQVQDKLVVILIIKGCKYNGLRKWLAQQQPFADVACTYLVTVDVTVDKIKNGVWSEDHKKTHTGKPSCY